MKTILLTLLLFLNGILCLAQNKISDALMDDIQQARASGTSVEALIVLSDRIDIQALDAALIRQKATCHERGVAVVTALMEHAERTQAELISYLESLKGTDVVRYHSFWIDNIIFVEATPQALLDIAQHRDVAQLEQNEHIEQIKPVTLQPASRLPGHAEPGLRAIHADKMWQLGFTGEGVIVGAMDTGADGNHPAISSQWHGNHVPASQAWYDPTGQTTFPTDEDGHGTHVNGTMTGLDPGTSDTVGVAFGAEWICGRIINWQMSELLAIFEWFADPDENPATTEDMPDVVNNSWGGNSNCDPPFINPILNLEAAGVAVIFAAGNAGPGSGTMDSPAKSNFTDLQVFSVGALDGNYEDLPIAVFSSRGPTVCTQGGNQIKPEVSAPGNNVRSSCLDGTYAYLGGTSMATPHVCGALALLKQAFPDKTGNELKQMLYETARDLGEPGEDNTYGMGIIDVYQAYIENAVPENPRPPGLVTVYSDYTTPTSASLTWTDPTSLVNGDPLEHFEIRIYRDNILIASIPAGMGSFYDTGLSDGQSYEYWVETHDLSSGNLSIQRTVKVWAGGSPVPAPPSDLAGNFNTFSGITLSWSDPVTQSDGTPLDDLDRIYIYRDGELAGDVAPATETWHDNGPVYEQSYSYKLAAADNETPVNYSKLTAGVDVFAGEKPDILVYHGIPSGQPVLDYADSVYRAIRFFTPSVYKTDDLAKFGLPLDNDAVFLVTGAQSYQTFLTPTEGSRIGSYLSLGGSVYVEGNMCFNSFQILMGSYNMRPFLGLDAGNWIFEPLNVISGLNDFSGMTYEMPPIDGFWDILDPATSTMTLWEDPSNGNILGVYNEYMNGKIIGVVPPYAELYMEDHPENKIYLMCRYLEMLGVEVGCFVGDEELAVGGQRSAVSVVPNPAFSRSEIKYQIAEIKNVVLKVLDINGSEVCTLVNNKQASGEYTVSFDASGLPAGIYLIQLQAEDLIETVRVVVMK